MPRVRLQSRSVLWQRELLICRRLEHHLLSHRDSRRRRQWRPTVEWLCICGESPDRPPRRSRDVLCLAPIALARIWRGPCSGVESQPSTSVRWSPQRSLESSPCFDLFEHVVYVGCWELMPRRFSNGAQLRFHGSGLFCPCLAERLAHPLRDSHSLSASNSLNLDVLFLIYENLKSLSHVDSLYYSCCISQNNSLNRLHQPRAVPTPPEVRMPQRPRQCRDVTPHPLHPRHA